jgi:hypothetical protein
MRTVAVARIVGVMVLVVGMTVRGLVVLGVAVGLLRVVVADT